MGWIVAFLYSITLWLWWVDTGWMPGTKGALSPSSTTGWGRKMCNERLMSWDKDREKSLFIYYRGQKKTWLGENSWIYYSQNKTQHSITEVKQILTTLSPTPPSRLLILLLRERNLFINPPWGPSHRRQFSTNFSSVNPLPWCAVHQEQLDPAWVPHEVTNSTWKPASAWASLTGSTDPC